MLMAINLCQPEVVTPGHRLMAVAAIFGVLFSIAHTVTFIITTVGPGWGEGPALYLDLMGYLSGVLFAVLCWKNSSKSPEEGRKENIWICVWAVATGSVRLLDSPMILGVVDLPAVYPTPSGAVQIANIVSEVFIGNIYAITACVSSIMLIRSARVSTPNNESSTLLGELGEA